MNNPFDQFDAPAAANPFDKFDAPEPKPAGAIRKLSDLALSVGKGVVAVPEAAVGLADLATGGRAGKVIENAGVRFKDAKDVLTGLQSDDLKGKQQEFSQADGVVDKFGVALSNPSLIANTVAESVPSMLGGGVAARGVLAAAPKLGAAGAGALGEGLVGAGSAAEGVRQQTGDGLLTGTQAALAGATGVATAGFGAVGGLAARKLGIGDVDTMIAQGGRSVAGAAGQAPKGIIRRTAEGALSEGVLEELPQSLSEQAFQNAALDKPLTEGLADAGVMGVLSGGAMGGAAGAISRQTPQPAADDVPGVPPAAPAETLPDVPAFPVDVPAAPTPAQAMGIDASAGPLSAAAALSVDTGLTQQVTEKAALEQAAALASKAPAATKKEAEQPTESQPAAEQAPAASGQFASEDDAKAYISDQRRSGGARIEALPLPRADGSFGLAIKDSPDYPAAEFHAKQQTLRAAGVLDGDLLNKTGDIFSAKQKGLATMRANRAGPGHVVVPVTGGFVIRQGSIDAKASTPATPAAPTTPADQPAAPLPAGTESSGRADAGAVDAAAPEQRDDALKPNALSAEAVYQRTLDKIQARYENDADTPARDVAKAQAKAVFEARQPKQKEPVAQVERAQAAIKPVATNQPEGTPDNAQANETIEVQPPAAPQQASEPVAAETARVEKQEPAASAASAEAAPTQTPETGTVEPAGQPAAGDEAGNTDVQAAGVDEGLVVTPGKGLIKGKFLSSADGDGTPGGPWATEAEALNAAKSWREKRKQNDTAMVADRTRKDTYAQKLRGGHTPTSQEVEGLGLRAAGSELTYFIPRAAELFGITSRQVRPLIADMIRIGTTDMGAKRESVNPIKALAQIAQSQAAPANGLITDQNQPPAQANQTGAAIKNVAAKASDNIVGKKISMAWSAFTPASGTLNVPRADMPQIKAEHRGAMVNFLKARGIESQSEEVAADSLKPTQAEFSPAKVKKAKAFAGGDRSILVSADGHVLDGHHQWMAKREAGEPVKVIRLDAPIKDLLAAVKEFPSSGQASGATAPANPPNSEEKPGNKPLAQAERAQAATKIVAPEVSKDLTDARAGLAGLEADRKAARGSKRADLDGQIERIKTTIKELESTATIAKAAIETIAAATPARATGSARLEDSGQVLEGARKLYAKAYADKLGEGMSMDTAAVPLSKSWPEPDYQRMLDDGADPWAVAFAHAARDEVPNKPGKSWKLKGWVDKVDGLRKFTADVIDGKYTRAAIEDKARTTKALGDWLNKVDLYEAVGHANSLKGLTFSQGQFSMYAGKTYSPAKTMWTISQPSTSAQAAWSMGNWSNELAIGDSKAEAISKYKAVLAAEGDKAPAAKGATTFDIYSYRGKPGFIIGKKIGTGKHLDLKTFDTAKEAREFKSANQVELERLLAAAKEVPPERRDTNLPRVGADHRSGADVTTEQFRDTFGFRGEQFGASMPQDERQSNMNQAYDALMDMAGVIGVPPKALSLNGELGLAFGARGTGGKNAFAAHYEADTTGKVTPNRVVINLTRKNGAGSLAHEWFHAVDNYFARARGEKGGFLTNNPKATADGVRPEMVDAFKALMLAVNSSSLRERSKNLDKRRTKDYWSTGLEMAARSFESYVIAKLQDQNAANDYLANIVSEQEFKTENGYPYPTAAELPQIRAAFDHFFDTVQTREDDDGNVAMFSRSQDDAAEPDTEEANALAALAQNDDLFALPKSDKTTLASIVADMQSGITVKKEQNTPGREVYTFTMPDGKTASLTVRPFNPYADKTAPTQYGYTLKDGEMTDIVTQRPGTNPEDVPPTDDLWIDVSKLQPGTGGLQIYNIAATYAHNTGKLFIGDPAGLSDDAMRRRTEQMLSSALKFGTTSHLAPHPRQADGDKSLGIPPLKWTYGDDLGNIRALIETSLANYSDVNPFTFEPSTGRYLDSQGDVANERALSLAADEGPGRTTGAGITTLQRNAVFQSLVREEGSEGSSGRPGAGLLERLVAASVQYGASTREIFYSQPSTRAAGRTASLAAQAQANSAVEAQVNAIKAKWANAPKIVVAFDMQDAQIPQRIRDEDLKQRSGGATGTPEGFYYKGTAYLMSSKLKTPEDTARVLFHEVLGHAGLRGMFGDALKPILKEIAILRKPQVDAKIKEYGLRGVNNLDRLTAAEEVLAELAQSRPEIGFVKRAIAAIRTWLRTNVPGFEKLALTDAEIIRSYILPARGWVERGGVQESPAGVLAFALETKESLAQAERAQAAINYIASDTPMFSRTSAIGDTLNNAMNNAKAVKLPAGYLVGDFFNGSGKLGWWHKSVGTQYNLAQREPLFKRVYDGVQNFLNDVSYYATEAADLAPNILPKLDTWKDITRTPLSVEDNKAIAAPIFEGTLTWARDENGNPVQMSVLEDKARAMSAEQKARELMRQNAISETVLKMWQGLPVGQYETLINSRYTSQVLQAGIVWTRAELKSQFNLTDKQADLYGEFRGAIDKSLTTLAISDMVRYGGEDVAPVAEAAMEAKTVEDASTMLRDYLLSMSEGSDRKELLIDMANKLIEKSDKARSLMDKGYAPLSRFGTYSLDVVDTGGERVYFGLFESKADAAKMARRMAIEFPGSTIRQGTTSEQSYKLFAGVSPETLELFGEMLGLESQGDDASSKAFQEYLKLARSSRSAMKRLIQRKGIAGFSEDPGRVLAGFIYSNARQTAGALHTGEIGEAVNDIPQGRGELKDAAIGLQSYIKNPEEEAAKFKGLLFAQYLGGSVASAMVNMTQPLTVTFPYLSQFGGVAKAAGQMRRAAGDVMKKTTGDKALDAAIKLAEEQGIVAPQEVHQLMAQANGAGGLLAGDGTTAGNATATAQNYLSKLTFVWGKLFSSAEQFNRRLTFIAAYRTAIEQGINDPAGFAEKVIAETQFTYNKGSKPRWARGAIGGTLFTFKQYSINYLELISRMATQGGPEGKKAALLMVAVLMLMGGGGGLPFAEDLEDLIDGIMQRLGYNFSAKQKRNEFFADLLGQNAARFMDSGVSGLPGVPIDLSGRMGMGNLLPGTGLFTKKTDYTRDVMEVFGPAGDLATRVVKSGDMLTRGELTKAADILLPVAGRNLTKAFDMANTGLYRDQTGKKVIDVDAYDVAAKAIGFQPNDVARVQDSSRAVQLRISQNKLRETEIADKWAQGQFEKNPDKVAEARAMLLRWNENNPDAPIRINMMQIGKRVRAMNMSKEDRISKTAPREIRESVRRELMRN